VSPLESATRNEVNGRPLCRPLKISNVTSEGCSLDRRRDGFPVVLGPFDGPHVGHHRGLGVQKSAPLPFYPRMPSFVSWVDYSSAERLRMRQAVALFDESDTRDELGIGSIRDAFADELFPGTSVIQTRLRYALFVPWLYTELEGDRTVTSANVERRARKAELDLIPRLVERTGDAIGVIGRRAGRDLQRPPSGIYWLLLHRWGVFRPRWTLDEYHRRWDRLRLERGGQRRTDDRGVLQEGFETWNSEMPPAPEDFPGSASFDLRYEEAEFIRGRIADSCAGSLLAHAATTARRPDLNVEEPWLAFGDLPHALTRTLALARRFALLVRGAALVYNLALARHQSGRDELATKLDGELKGWAEEAERLRVADGTLDELWAFCAARANVSPRTREFMEHWQALMAADGCAGAARSPDAHQLVEQRERQLKGSRSRFGNARALELWGGQSGTGLLTYRWGTAQRFLADLYRGLGTEGD
jgi:hypothetical protein